jgi:hypothetical protein
MANHPRKTISRIMDGVYEKRMQCCHANASMKQS